MKGLEFQIFHMGSMMIDKGWHVSMPSPATRSNPHPEPELWLIPEISLLIRHPNAGYLLFDTGWAPSTPRNAMWDEFFPLEITREHYMDRQLERVGLKPSDISAVILSHFHWDHAGGLEFFSHTEAGKNVYASKADFTEALLTTHTDSEADVGNYYLKEVMDIPGLNFHLIEEDTTLMPGVDLILLGGHTPGVLGLVLHLESGTWIFPSDAIFNHEVYGPPMKYPGIIYDSLNFARGVDKVRNLQKKYDATIVFSHDPQTLRQFRLAPHIYR